MSFARLAEIEKMQKTDHVKFWSEATQQEYKSLLNDVLMAPGAPGTGPMSAWQAETGGQATGPSWASGA